MDPPEKPDPADCCNSGCNPCILDLYEIKLRKYERDKTRNIHNKSQEINIIKDTSYTGFKLISIDKIIEDNVVLYTFEYCNTDKVENYVLKFVPGQYFILKSPKDFDTHFTRPYTPIICRYVNNKLILTQSIDITNKLIFQIIVKLEQNGAMSNYLRNLKLQDLTLWRGPYGNFDYQNLKSLNKFTHLICFTQGIGIAPIFCIINSILENELDETYIILNSVYRNIESIILREEIQNLGQFWNFKNNIYLAHSKTCSCDQKCDCFNDKIKYGENIYDHRLTIDDVKNDIIKQINIPDIYFLICGNEKFSNDMKSILLDLMIDEINIHVF